MGQSRKGGGDNDGLAVCDRIHNREAEENCKVGSPCQPCQHAKLQMPLGSDG
jgi:hypothetical protein